MNKLNALKIENSGLLSLIQDAGRQSATSLGVAPSGFADPYAAQWANRLVSNPIDTCLVEITGGGLVAKVCCDGLISLCGAKIPLKINGELKVTWRSYRVKSGDLIELGYAESGLRGYLSFSGGILSKEVFGSSATNVRELLGGLEGKGNPLKSGDMLPSFQLANLPVQIQAPKSAIPIYPNEVTLRFVRGYQYSDFASHEMAKLELANFEVGQRMDRMGVQLKKHKVNSPNLNLPSEGIAYGAIQVPPDGHPIVMLVDRQTIGGYPKIGSVLSIDAAKLSQLQPGARVKLKPIDIEQAHNLLHLDKLKNQQLVPLAC